MGVPRIEGGGGVALYVPKAIELHIVITRSTHSDMAIHGSSFLWTINCPSASELYEKTAS